MTAEDFARAVDEGLRRPLLSAERRIYGWLSAANALTLHRPTQWLIESGLAHGLTVVALKEVLLQNYLFCGFPTSIEGLIILNKVRTNRRIPNEDFTELRGAADIQAHGENLCRKIYSNNFDKLAAHMQSLSADIYDWMIREGYGKVLSRSVLPAVERELCIISSLAALRRERQLISHLKGARHVGASGEEIRECLKSLQLLASDDTVTLALDIFDQTFRRDRPTPS
jgi:alkylhydroperoxidase/carboxymuconolactone decarboxylase family protein YurZ